MRFWKRLAIFAMAVGFSTSVYAQGIRSTTGNIYGKATDESGGVLPGVSITLSGVGAPRTVTTGSQGDFRFINIDPGTYVITAELSGMTTVKQENVIVQTGSNTDVRITLKISAVAATVTVSGEVPLLDPRKGRTGTNFSPEEMKSIPTSRDPWGMLQMSAGVLTDNVITGANNNGQQSVFVGKGTNFTNNAWNIDGIPSTDLAANGASPTYYDFDAFQEMQFSTGGADPSNVVPGVTLNMVTKRGTNDVHGSARINDTPSEFEAFNTNPELTAAGFSSPRINNVQDYGVEVGGPAWRDHLWLWGSFGHQQINTFTSSGSADNTQLEDYNVKVNGQAIESNSLTLFYFRGNKTKQGRLGTGGSAQHPPPSTWNQTGPSHFQKIEDSQVVGSNIFGTVSYSFVNTPFNLDPQGGTAVEVVRDFPSRAWLNSYYTDHNYRPQHTVQGTGSFFFNAGSLGNEVKFGATYTTYSQRHTRFWPGDGVYTDLRPIATHDPAYPFSADITRADVDGEDLKSIGGFVGDTLTAGDLTVQLGVRFDSFYGYNSPSIVPGNPNPSVGYLLPALTYAGGGADFHSTRWSPRLGLTYALGPQKTTLLRASYSRFADQLGTSQVSSDNPLGLVARAVYQWNGHYSGPNGTITTADICLTCPFTPVNYDPTNPSNPISPNTVDRNLKAPITDEVTAGIEHQILPELVAGVTYTYRKRKDFIWNCPMALDNSAACLKSSDYFLWAPGFTGADFNGNPVTSGPLYAVNALTPFLANGVTPNPGYNAAIAAAYTDGNFETNRPDYSTTYHGIEFQLTKRLSNKWMAHGSFTWNSWKQNVSNVATGCIDPTNQVAVGANLFNLPLNGNTCANGDIAYDYFGTSWINAKWAFAFNGLYQLPWNFSIAASVFGHQGYPVPYYYIANPNDSLGDRFLAVDNADGHRLASVYEADMSVQKVVPIAGKAEITLSIDLFNVFNTKTITFRQSEADAAIAGQATNAQNPRVLRLGARVTF